MKNVLFRRYICAICAVFFALSVLILPSASEETLPDCIITEVCFNTTYKTNDFDVSTSADMLEFIEIKNTSGHTLDLTGWTVTYRSGDWDSAVAGVNYVTQVLAEGGYSLKAGDIAVFAVYTQDAVKVGLKYDTAEDYQAVYNTFTDINGGKSLLPIENFYLIPKAKSGELENIEGTFNLPNEKDLTVLTVLDNGGNTVCECKYNPNLRNRNNYSVNFMYTGSVSGHPKASEEFNVASPTPGKLFENQIIPLAEGLTAPDGSKTLPLTLMEYNVCATDSEQTHADGSAISMAERAAGVFATIQANNPDVICFCEINYLWRDYLNANIDGDGCQYVSYGISSTGRAWDASKLNQSVWDLFNLISWKKDKYDLIDKGTFWCSKSPDRKGTYGWADKTPGDFARGINWVILEEKQTGARFFVLCQHIDAKNSTSREYSTELIAQYATELSQGLPVIMTGDWNCGDGSKAYANLMASGKFADARYRTVSPENMTLYGSFNSWGGNTKMTAMAPIDHCIISKDSVFVKYAKTDYGLYDEAKTLYASDHNATVYGLEYTVMSSRTEETTAEDTTAEKTTFTETENKETSVPETVAATETTFTEPNAEGCGSAVLFGVMPIILLGSLLLRKKNDRA